jgi:hypothetical protein
LLAGAVYAGVFVYVLARNDTLAGITVAFGVFGGGTFAYALLRRASDLVLWPVLLLGTAYAITLFAGGSGVDEGAPLVAAGLLLATELAAWSFDEGRPIKGERAVVIARGGAVLLLVLGGLAASALVVALAAAPIGGGLGWTVLGAAAAVVVVGLAARLGR